MSAPPVRPEIVTRFYGEPTYALEVIEQSKIALVNVTKLNDPFDPYYYFENDFGDDYHRLRTYVRLNEQNFFDRFEKHVTQTEFRSGLKRVRDFFAHRAKTTYVLSTASEYNGLSPSRSLYMWGHYGDGHRGVAIDFSTESLRQSLLAYNRACGNPAPPNQEVWIEMDYLNDVPPITAQVYAAFLRQSIERRLDEPSNADGLLIDNILTRMLRLKSEDWRREAEWRLMWGRDTNESNVQFCPIGLDAMQAVYFGLRLQEDIRRSLERALERHPHVKIHRARKQRGNFRIEFE